MKIRMLYLTIIIAICSIVFCIMMRSSDVETLYFGISYTNIAELYMINWAFYSCYCFLCFSRTENFLMEYGLHLVVRNHSRKRILIKYIVTISKEILILELIKITVFLIAQYFIFHKITGSVTNLLYDGLLYIIVIFTMVLLQVMIEIYINATIGLIVNMCSYLFFSFIGSFLYIQYLDTDKKMGVLLNSFFLTNYSMNFRVNSFIELLHYSKMITVIMLVAIFIVLGLLLLKKFSKKDLL